MVALVLLPGMDGTGELFDDFLRALGPGIRPVVVAYPLDRALNYDQLEGVVRLNLPLDEPYVLLGESFSGPIAVSIAAAAPPQLRGLVLCCSFVKNSRPMLRALEPFIDLLPVRGIPSPVLSRALLGRFSTPRARQALAIVMRGVSPVALRARMRAVLRADVGALLTRVRVPMLYLKASEDRIVPSAAAELISRLSPGVRVVEIEAPHFLLQAVPEEAALCVRSFVGGDS